MEETLQEFSFPFVGREEELYFLFREYDAMLHAEYRSLWIEAPAGMGKTTLVEEFLKRIDVTSRAQRDARSPLKPWIVHAHLRERSSNSLSSLVEALGVTLQTLTEPQRDKLFSGLTSFYRERAKKLVGGGNIQSMDMEEAITTAGYILKQLSKYFPLIVIIEDIHVLKGELSFYALRQLQIIAEHVPMVMMYLARPGDDKQLAQFRNQVMKEGCRKYELGSLVYDDVEKLVGAQGVRPVSDVKKLMHLSGGNALLLRELLRSGTVDDRDSKNSTTEKIIHHLTKELRKLSKKDRQVVAIAGILGEEFLEKLLEGISQAKDFRCWSDGVLPRLESRGIIRRRKKVLTSEGEDKEVVLRMGVFSHALWWEAARRLYNKEKVWTDRKFAETIVPMLSHQSYPLFTDAGLLINLFRWVSAKNRIDLFHYADTLVSVETRWSFYSREETRSILEVARQEILKFLVGSKYFFNKRSTWTLVRLLNAYQVNIRNHSESLKNNRVMEKLIQQHGKTDVDFMMFMIERIYGEAYWSWEQQAENSNLDKGLRHLKSWEKYVDRLNDEQCRHYFIQVLNLLRGFKEWYQRPTKAGNYLLHAIEKISWERADGQYLVVGILLTLKRLLLDQKKVREVLVVAKKFKSIIVKSEKLSLNIRLAYRAEIELLLKTGKVEDAKKRWQEMCQYIEKNGRRGIMSLKIEELQIIGFEYDYQRAQTVFPEWFSEGNVWVEEVTKYGWAFRTLFYFEDIERIEKCWNKYQDKLILNEKNNAILFIELRILILLLEGRENEVNNMLKMQGWLKKKFPLMEEAVRSSQKKLKVFIDAGNGGDAKTSRFEKFLQTDKTLSPFDKAHYAYLYARIGVKHGHAPKEFSNYVRYSLAEFEKLGIPKRVVFTAQKFYEEGLLPEDEYKRLTKKYRSSVKENSGQTAESQNTKQDNQVKVENIGNNNREGIKLCCFGELAVYAPDGKELVTRWWGKRKHAPSVYKRIMLELVRAKMLGRDVSREELLRTLFPELRKEEVSKHTLRRCSRLLSMYLPQLRQGFLPYSVIEKTENGYSLHSSVRVDILDVKQAISKAKMLKTLHPPSSSWLLTKSMYVLSRGEFAKGIHGKSFNDIRREAHDLKKECSFLLSSLQNEFSFLP